MYLSVLFKRTSLLIILFAIIFIGCKNEIDKETPTLELSSSAIGLSIIITGNLNDTQGIISEIKVDWGDNTSIQSIYAGLDDFQIEHKYFNPDTYTVNITAYDLIRIVLSDSINSTINFNETSLDGINESMFKANEKEYLILTLNIHTYQESYQAEKLNMITDLIGLMDIDFIAFQECAQHKNALITSGIIREDNMAKLITEQLNEKYEINYNYVWNWAHYGWNVWEEGVSVLSKHSLIDQDERYVSSVSNIYNIESRKVIYGSYQTPDGLINIFSAHTHWRKSETDEEQNNQINKIKLMVDEKEALNTIEASIVCGDFNVNPTSDYPWSEGYTTMIGSNEYFDTFLEINTEANTKPPLSQYYTVGGTYPGRIDYIFMKNTTNYSIESSQIIFKSGIVGEVSDHFGVLTKIKYLN